MSTQGARQWGILHCPQYNYSWFYARMHFWIWPPDLSASPEMDWKPKIVFPGIFTHQLFQNPGREPGRTVLGVSYPPINPSWAKSLASAISQCELGSQGRGNAKQFNAFFLWGGRAEREYRNGGWKSAATFCVWNTKPFKSFQRNLAKATGRTCF